MLDDQSMSNLILQSDSTAPSSYNSEHKCNKTAAAAKQKLIKNQFKSYTQQPSLSSLGSFRGKKKAPKATTTGLI
jgi:hypothetical protein